MSLFSKKITVVTHNGKFHSDDVFALATLRMVFDDNIKVIRTRDPKTIEAGDYVVDVGGVYEPAKKRFDHHQIGGAGKRVNAISYASFGLIWKEFGEKLCGSPEVADMIEKKLVQVVDADDNGQSLMNLVYPDVIPFTFRNVIFSYMPNWNEPHVKMDDRFAEAVEFAKGLLEREIKKAQSKHEGNKIVEQVYRETADKRIIVLDNFYPWNDVLSKYPEPLFVISPDRENNTWHVGALNDPVTFKSRKDLPAAWAGKRDAELAAVTGVPDSVFSHNALHMAVAKSKEGALALAKLALT